ncbi:hypothetical protein POSPLADRAFT_1139219 [Postia placenta MAD-698-R-SB12]|uniref:Uncharacterized protein n=1 Tax=Postia placenta MAD-698-R-SB12 TaxID=670580 RepID=A0A1X6N4L8_9APHY|nr:hypothetical protein POSPLADRAFT_1139219 [Postia placenta MAD-698-R-SB12]OSX63589.1 hypothetical protein POSPLADRAFT_1139219 [Postia placenta MAD-698-R-SB12]
MADSIKSVLGATAGWGFIGVLFGSLFLGVSCAQTLYYCSTRRLEIEVISRTAIPAAAQYVLGVGRLLETSGIGTLRSFSWYDISTKARSLLNMLEGHFVASIAFQDDSLALSFMHRGSSRKASDPIAQAIGASNPRKCLAIPPVANSTEELMELDMSSPSRPLREPFLCV